MESLQFLLEGFATAATPVNLLLALLGVVIGTAVGVLPGIGPAMTVALLLPVTYGLEPTSAMIIATKTPAIIAAPIPTHGLAA